MEKKYLCYALTQLKLDFLALSLSMRQYVDLLDGCLDFTFQNLVKEYIARDPSNNKNLISNPIYDESQLPLKMRLWLFVHSMMFPKRFLLPSFVDNHDMNRFIFDAGNDEEKLKRAAEALFRIQGRDQPVVLYYGTEIGMSQVKSIHDHKAYGDLEARRMMRWDQIEAKRYLIDFFKKLIRERKQRFQKQQQQQQEQEMLESATVALLRKNKKEE
eukprot:GEZU01010435.1.p1 GENE.GEZU01010435.1~~GEZU01010435.1.p1  ORF type:complete len:215 (+),score=81.85 GEZU01010435.1:176-820(+)